MKRFLYTIILVSLALFMTSCSGGKNKVNYNTTSPEDVVKSYFLALDNKDNEFISIVTDKTSNLPNCKDIKSIKLVSIKENSKIAEGFIKYRKQSNTKYYDVKSYNIVYELKMKLGKDRTNSSGKLSKILIMTKDAENSNWIIREIGEG